MFSRSTGFVCIGLVVLSGMFLMGQESQWPCTCTDNDGDGYGNPACDMCTHPEQDCDDTNPDVYPNALEQCDGIDNQCPGDSGYGQIDEQHQGMACIPSGCFEMGDHFAEGGAHGVPVHNVCISAFEMDVHEVTNAEYKSCVDVGMCTPPYYSSSYSRATYYGDPTYDDFPVILVDWYQATDYCSWAGNGTKRLPTEAEWEYAARGGLAGKRYPWGDTISGSDANYWDSGDPWDNDTSEVEFYEPQLTSPNGYGLYDVAGNVWEWVNDWYSETYYQECYDGVFPYCLCPGGLPPCTCYDPPGPSTDTYRVLRGSSWYFGATYPTVAGCTTLIPSTTSDQTGFRCAR